MTLVKDNLSISIIVPCRNEAGAIGGFLKSLTALDLDGYNWEAIIADGMSDDGTREVLRDFERQKPSIRVIDNPERTTSAALNAAILSARGSIILRMDVHSEYAPDYVRRCVETLLTKRADNVGGPARTRSKGPLAEAIAAAYHSRFACGGAKFHDEDYEGPVDTVPYGCWRKETLETLGLFDPMLVRNQDDELNLRLTRQGGTIWQSPAIKSWYSPRSTLASLFKQYYQYGFWKVPIILKYRTPASWRHLVPGGFVFINLALLAIAAIAAAAGSTSISARCLLLFALIFAVYAISVIGVSLLTASQRGWRLLPHLPPVFASYHLSYGFGFLTGVGYTLVTNFTALRPGKLFTQVTR